MTNAAALDRFWARVDKTETCWLWTAGRTAKGYGMVQIARERRYVHRFVYELLVGPIEEGMVIDHLCHVRHCVNPEHLRVVTSAVNTVNRAGAQRNSKSGVRGVYRCADRWRAQAKAGGQIHDGGVYATIEEAERAAIALRKRLGMA